MHENLNINSNREKIKVLDHHVSMVKEMYPEITDLTDAKNIVANDIIPSLEEDLHSDGTKCYPNINKDKFVNNLARIIVAVNENNFENIPDYKSYGNMNKDIACEACGNLQESLFSTKCRLVNKKRELTLKHYYESLRTPVHFKKYD